MITRYRVAMDGVQLDSLSDSIIIHDITEQPQYNIKTAERPVSNGMNAISRRRSSLSVMVSFEIHEYDIAERQKIAEKICSWAAGRELTCNTRGNKRLLCMCTSPVAINSALRWTENLSVTFTAYEQPYWEDAEPSALGEVNHVVTVPGTSDTVLESTITNTSGEVLPSLSVQAGNSIIALENLSFGTDDTITIGHTPDGWLTIKQGDVSIYGHLMPTSSDDLTVPAGPVAVSASTGIAVQWECRGRWA